MDNYFTKLSEVDCSGHVEKKGRFSYLSWTYAISELLKRHPKATWDVKRFNGFPFMASEAGYFVEVGVTVDGVERAQIHPVLDNSNKPIAKPNAFQINTSIQRALVKAIALHGLGLYIYAGEDLPEVTESPLDAGQLATIRSALGDLRLDEVEFLAKGNYTCRLEDVPVSHYEGIKNFLDSQTKHMGEQE